MILHIDIKHFVQQHAHHRRLPRRVRLRPIVPNAANQLWYTHELLRIVKFLRTQAHQHILPALRQSSQHLTGDGVVVGDAMPASVGAALNSMARSFGGIQFTAQRLAQLAVRRNQETVDAKLTAAIKDAVGVDVGAVLGGDGRIRQAMAAATRANVELITSIPYEYLDKLEKNITKNFVEGGRYEKLTDIVSHVADVTETRAKLIARDQTSKMNSSFNQVRQTELGIEKYEWQTSHDERVRETHAENDGKVFAWADPPDETGNPGEDINCRCNAIPYFDLDALEQDSAEDTDGE